MAEALTTLARLRVVREIQEHDAGAALCFHQGAHGRLALSDANYSTHLRLARRSQERQHPVGVTFGEGDAITELVRADNDVPARISEEEADHVQVLFHGHDGVFRLKADHPEYARVRALLDDAMRQKARVWFVAQKADLSLVDVLPACAEDTLPQQVCNPYEKLLEDHDACVHTYLPTDILKDRLQTAGYSFSEVIRKTPDMPTMIYISITRIAAAMEIASLISSGVAPDSSALLRWPSMQP